jgi:predicted nucleic acid-binding Zn ribbon protein/transposase
MTRLKQPVRKHCEYCGKEFEAGKTTTRCCSDYCSKRAYKEAKRKKVAELTEDSSMLKKVEKEKNQLSGRQGYSIAETAILLGKSRRTIHRYVVAGEIKAKRLSSKFTIIPQKSIDDFLNVAMPYEMLPTKERKPIDEWYTLKEVTKKYGIKYRQLRNIINREHIPEKKKGRTTLLAKGKTDTYFKNQKYNESLLNLSEWLTFLDVRAKYNLSESAARSFLSENKIPKKQKDGKRYYSKFHIDTIKNKTQ